MNLWKRLKRLWELSGTEGTPVFFGGVDSTSSAGTTSYTYTNPINTATSTTTVTVTGSSKPATIVRMTDPLEDDFNKHKEDYE